MLFCPVGQNLIEIEKEKVMNTNKIIYPYFYQFLSSIQTQYVKGLLLWGTFFHHVVDCVLHTDTTGQLNTIQQDVEMDKTSAGILSGDTFKSFSSLLSFVYLFEVHTIF